MSNLKPCPFCGGEAHARTSMAFDRLHKWTVECNTEDCMGFFGCSFFEHEAEAIEAWNTRAERTCQIIQHRCTNCDHEINERAYFERVALDDGCWTAESRAANYCPNCGAKVVE